MPSERRKLDHSAKLIQKFQHLPEIRRIVRHRHVPKLIHKLRQTKHEMKMNEDRKERNRRKRTRADKLTPLVRARKQNVVTVVE